MEYKTKKRKGKECREIESVNKSSTQPDGVTVWHDRLHIPPVPPTGLNRCKLIDINYELEVGTDAVINMNGKARFCDSFIWNQFEKCWLSNVSFSQPLS